MIWTVKQLEEVLSIKLPHKSVTFNKVQFNSQDVEPGDLFIALPGKRDGHDFVSHAIQQGAAGVIVSQDINHSLKSDSDKIIKVPDTYVALEKMAAYKRFHSRARFIGITGSVGKTSTKEQIKVMLNNCGRTFASRGNFNNYLGNLINLASMPDDTEYAIFEMGMSGKGEIHRIAELIKPDVALITSISEGHLAFFTSVQEIAEAKCEIFTFLGKDGIAIINEDTDYFYQCVFNLVMLSINNILTFGTASDANVRFAEYNILPDKQVKLTYIINHNNGNSITRLKGENEDNYLIDHYHYDRVFAIIPYLPKSLAGNFAAGLAVVKALKLDIEKAVKGMGLFTPAMGRGKIIVVSKEQKNYALICDYYNANPESMKAALNNLIPFEDLKFKSLKKSAILGDMAELGSGAVPLHLTIIPNLIAAKVDKVFLVGDIMKNIYDYLPRNIQAWCYQNVDLLVQELDQFLKNEIIAGGELILIKGSRCMRLEKVAEYFGVKNAL